MLRAEHTRTHGEGLGTKLGNSDAAPHDSQNKSSASMPSAQGVNSRARVFRYTLCTDLCAAWWRYHWLL